MGRLIISPIIVCLGLVTHKVKNRPKQTFREIWNIYSYWELYDQGIIILLDGCALMGAISMFIIVIITIILWVIRGSSAV